MVHGPTRFKKLIKFRWANSWTHQHYQTNTHPQHRTPHWHFSNHFSHSLCVFYHTHLCVKRMLEKDKKSEASTMLKCCFYSQCSWLLLGQQLTEESLAGWDDNVGPRMTCQRPRQRNLDHTFHVGEDITFKKWEPLRWVIIVIAAGRELVQDVLASNGMKIKARE